MTAPAVQAEFHLRVRRWVMQWEADAELDAAPYTDAEVMFQEFLVTTRAVSLPTIRELTADPLPGEADYLL